MTLYMVSMAARTELLQSPDAVDAAVPIGLNLPGPPRPTVAGDVVAPGARKVLGLLAALALGGRSTPARLVTLPWPGLDAHSARRNLRRELHRLRSIGAPLARPEDGAAPSLAPEVEVDVALFLPAPSRDWPSP